MKYKPAPTVCSWVTSIVFCACRRPLYCTECKTTNTKCFKNGSISIHTNPDNLCLTFLFFAPRKKTDPPDCRKSTSLQENIQRGGIPEGKTQSRFELMLASSLVLPLQHEDKSSSLQKEMQSVKMDWNVFVLLKCAHPSTNFCFPENNCLKFIPCSYTILLQ